MHFVGLAENFTSARLAELLGHQGSNPTSVHVEEEGGHGHAVFASVEDAVACAQANHKKSLDGYELEVAQTWGKGAWGEMLAVISHTPQHGGTPDLSCYDRYDRLQQTIAATHGRQAKRASMPLAADQPHCPTRSSSPFVGCRCCP